MLSTLSCRQFDLERRVVFADQLDLVSLGSVIIELPANEDAVFSHLVLVIGHGGRVGGAGHWIHHPSALACVAVHNLRSVEIRLALGADAVENDRRAWGVGTHDLCAGLHGDRLHLADSLVAANGCEVFLYDLVGR